MKDAVEQKSKMNTLAVTAVTAGVAGEEESLYVTGNSIEEVIGKTSK